MVIAYVEVCLFNEGVKAVRKGVPVDEGKAEGLEEGRAQGKAEGLKEGKAEGLKEGRAEGLAEGEEKGLTEGKIKAIIEFMKDGFISEEDAAKRANMTLEEFRKAEALYIN